MNILFISNEDPFTSLGGAGQNSLGLIENLLKKEDVNIEYRKPQLIDASDILGYDLFILEDFWGFPDDLVDLFLEEKYIIFENSYGFASDKFLGFHKREQKWIEKDLRHKYFYQCAEKVYLQSWFQYTIFEMNGLDFGNLECLDGNFWTEESIRTLEKYRFERDVDANIYPSPEDTYYVILDGKNPLHQKVKGVQEAVDYAKEKKLFCQIISPASYDEYLKILSNSAGLIFLPTVPETFSRVYIEAKYLNVSVISNNNIGAKRSSWNEGVFFPHKMMTFNSSASNKVWKQLNQ